jgi:hypothetical protein
MFTMDDLPNSPEPGRGEMEGEWGRDTRDVAVVGEPEFAEDWAFFDSFLMTMRSG